MVRPGYMKHIEVTRLSCVIVYLLFLWRKTVVLLTSLSLQVMKCSGHLQTIASVILRSCKMSPYKSDLDYQVQLKTNHTQSEIQNYIS